MELFETLQTVCLDEFVDYFFSRNIDFSVDIQKSTTAESFLHFPVNPLNVLKVDVYVLKIKYFSEHVNIS